MSSRSRLSRLAPLLALTITPLVGGCEAVKDGLLACAYDFSADVNEGSNAGMALSGELSLEEVEDGALNATYTDITEGDVNVGAEYIEGQITLTFSTGEGDVVGTGAFDIETCLETIEGELVGPAEDDAGDWAGTLQE